MPNSEDNKDINFKLGELSGRMTSTENKVTSLETTINNIDTKLDDIRDNMNKGRGAWKTIVIIGSILVAVGSVMSDLIAKLLHLS